MILKFPDLNALRLALVTGAVPANMSAAGAVAGFDDTGCVVETSATLPPSNRNELRRLNVQFPRTNGAADKTEVSCWAEILPLERDPRPLERLDSMPVLFDLISGEALARLVIEVLRLGNDRQAYRWLEDGAGKDASTRALLRVVGPPYYSLLRAMDRIGGPQAPVAFAELSPRVWVELGYAHPLIGQIKPPVGKLLLLRPPRQWEVIDEAPFREVYEVLEFPLPDRKVKWKEGELKKKVQVTPSLRPGGPAEGAELWVLRDGPVEVLNTFVQNAGDEQLQRLSFAVGQHDGKATIVLRVRHTKQAPPVVILEKATGYKHYLKLPNLFLPVGTRLHPPLRRDQVRKLLAEDASQVVWLQPGEGGSFTPMSLPEDSFRPLWDWIDYVLDHDQEALQAWVQAAQFDFEPFICDEDPTTKPRKPPSNEGGKRPRDRGGRDKGGDEVNFAPVAPEEAGGPETAAPLEELVIAKVEPSVVQKQLKELEERFLGLDGGLDTAERQEMWPQLAALNTQLNSTDDAGVCWMNALWERDEQAARAWAWHWFAAEAAAVPAREAGPRAQPRAWTAKALAGKAREVPGEELDRLLGIDEPATADLRALAAYLTFATLQSPPSAALVARLGPVSRFLEAHERLLPVRAVWLAWSHLIQLGRSNDVLALARARDRLLERLYHNGLRPEQDLPSFLRFAGQPTSQRFRAVRQWMVELSGHAQEWVREGSGNTSGGAQTLAYVDLIFAFGLARLGETDAAREALSRARAVLSTKDDAHQFLLAAYTHRVTQALDGKPHTGDLPKERLEELEVMERLARYVVDRLRKHSHILEPDQRINPYRHWGARISEFEKALSELTDLTDRNEMATRVGKLLAEVPKGSKGVEPRARVLKAGLEVAPRVGEEFARKMLDATVPAYDALPETTELAALMEQASFLERALFVAGHFGRVEAIHPLVARFQKMLQKQKGAQALQVLDSLAASCFRGLRKLGMRDEIDQILRQMAELVLEGQEVRQIDFKKRDQGPAALRALLQVAAGWFFFGRDSQAQPILEAARAVLLGGELSAPDQTKLACAYAKAIGQAPVEVAQKRLEEVFDVKKGVKGVKDTYTTSTHFSVSQLDVVESVVLAVVSDDFTMGAQARRWLDDDEFLVRRRIHRDVRQAMEKH